jgi:16S rRNA (guanine966-N2)-methyltransferase
MLGEVEGARVLDLYAGSGALGIEALSRGAAGAVFVERDPRAVAAIERNLEPLGVDAKVERVDAERYLDRSEGAFDLVFCDPPYDSAPRLAAPLADRLPALTSEHARIVTESDKRNPLVLPFPLRVERTYGDTRIAIYAR